jgi:rhamnosyltransferase
VTVALLIRCLNEEAHIGRLLAGAFSQTLPPDEVIVVDSGSTDATLEIAQSFPRVRVSHIAPREFSFGRAINRGMQVATADIVVLASAHVYPTRTTWLEELTRPFADDRLVLSYGRQVGDERTSFSEHQVLRKWFPDHSEPDQPHPFCNNANAAVRRAWWVGQPYDEELTGLEDLDWAKKAIAAGKKIAYVASAPVAHVHQESFRTVVNRYRREAIALKRIYPGHELGLGEAVTLAAGNMAADAYHAARSGELSELPEIIKFRMAQFLGGYLGHRQRGEVTDALKKRFYYPKKFWYKAEPDPVTGEHIEYALHS